MKQWYESLFENYGKKYDNENFTQGTIGECDFIEKEIDFDKSKKIIDVGCGTGRHSIELAKRDYKVTGIDLSESQLERAKEKAKDQTEITWLLKTLGFKRVDIHGAKLGSFSRNDKLTTEDFEMLVIAEK